MHFLLISMIIFIFNVITDLSNWLLFEFSSVNAWEISENMHQTAEKNLVLARYSHLIRHLARREAGYVWHYKSFLFSDCLYCSFEDNRLLFPLISTAPRGKFDQKCLVSNPWGRDFDQISHKIIWFWPYMSPNTWFWQNVSPNTLILTKYVPK